MTKIINTLYTQNAKYPKKLRNIFDPPKQLFYRGNVDCLQGKNVAIIGTRKPTAYGIRVATEIATTLATYGIGVVSGLAYGIDVAAHKACIDADGKAIAVLAGGLDTIYPKRHLAIADKIESSGGVLLSEYPPATNPQKHHFVARNRIVAGISDAVIVVEAAQKSGTLITTNFALETNTAVLAVPGAITSVVSAGTNQLLKEGAAVYTNISDVLHEIGLTVAKKSSKPHIHTPDERILLNIMRSGAQNNTFQPAIMTTLELRGCLKRDTAGVSIVTCQV